MLSLRAPLFYVSLAFASGCLIGLDGIIPLRAALVFWLIAGVVWIAAGQRETLSVGAFYLFALLAGIAYALIVNASVAHDDLRRLPEAKNLATTQWRGVVIEEPTAQVSAHATRRSPGRMEFVVGVRAWRPTEGRLFGADIDVPWQAAQGNVRCTLTGLAKELHCGDGIEFSAALVPVAAPLAPGQLDYRAWEAAQGIYYHATIAASNWQKVADGGGNWWQRLSYRARDWAYGRLQLGLEDDPRMADFLAGMLIGYRQEIPTDIEQDFRRTGTLHVFAVSGQNIAEMIVVAMILLQLCGLVRWRWAWTLAPLVLVYCLLTGSPSSAVRATVMALTVLMAWKLGRPLNALGCWSLAFWAMMIWEPSILLDPGAQLSFGVVLGLILIAPPLMSWIVRPFGHDPLLPRDLLTPAQIREEKSWKWFSAMLGASIAATLVSEPITAIDFHQVTPISVLANLVVVPVAGLITVVGTLSVAVSLVSGWLAGLLNNSNWLLARLLILFVGYLAHRPGASINVPDLRAVNSPEPSFIVAPVQESTALLVRTQEGAWLFNAGRETPTPSATWHLLQFYGINRLEGLVLTQMSVPDNGGAAMIARDFLPRHVVVPCLETRSPLEKVVPDLVQLSGGKLDKWQRGDRLDLGDGVKVEVLHPAPESPEGKAEDRGLVLLFNSGEGTLLWAGKIDAQAQGEILAANPGVHADVLVMGNDSVPDEDWVHSLGIRYWLQIPPRERQLNEDRAEVDATDFSEIWRLEQTGAVEIHFKAAEGRRDRGIELKPWVQLPAGTDVQK